MAEEYTPVVFEDAEGNEISNDPVWKAQQRLASAGVQSNDTSTLQKENEELKARLAELEAAASDDTSGTNDDGDEYDKLGGAELKSLAAERNVDITGLRKVGEVRQALRDAAGSVGAE